MAAYDPTADEWDDVHEQNAPDNGERDEVDCDDVERCRFPGECLFDGEFHDPGECTAVVTPILVARLRQLPEVEPC
jgi:hypothetical protein